MLSFSRFQLTTGALLRMVTDAALLQLSLILALVVRFYIVVNFEGLAQDATVPELLSMYIGWYLRTAIPLTILCLFVFYAQGFYTRGETYQSRYKVLVVIQAVSLSYLIYITAVLFFNVYDGKLLFAKAAMLLAWGFSIVLLAGARVWTQLWRKTGEHHPIVVADRDAQPTEPIVLVIGGGGYIGSALVPRLLESGYRVRVLDMMLYGEEPLEPVRNHPKLELIHADFRIPDQVVSAMRGVEAVVHLGAIVGDPACSLDESLTIDVNLCSTKMIADFAKQFGIQRFVFASTCSVYGAGSNILDERSAVRPLGIYGHTKYGSERVLLDMASATFQPTILRFATIFGLSGRTRFDLVVNLLTAKAKLDGEITVLNGNQWRPFVHVDDAARSIVAVLDAPLATVGGEIFNVGSNDLNYTILQIGELVNQQVPSAQLIASENDADKRDYRVDFTKIRNLLDFQTTWTLEEGVQQVLDAIVSGRVINYRDPQYSNVAFLSRDGTAVLARDRWARELIEDLTNQD
ncbi:MAG: NAD-dependent epimerase/dehydratase family protein [Planctomycetales bacterium]|nr:NAD-dependent epimerase/dehydratase family protein [Planctomycetales bacterium]